jgi:hypothetical protein
MRILLAIITSLLVLPGAAQDTLLFSPEYKTSRDMAQVGALAFDSLFFFEFEEIDAREDAIYLSKIEYATMQQTWRERIDIPQITDCEQNFRYLIPFADYFILFTTGIRKENNQIEAYASFIDFSGKLKTQPILVHKVPADNRASQPRFTVEVSPNKKYFITFFDPPFERKTNETFDFRCYSPDLDLIWEKNLELPYAQDIVQVHNYLLDNSANVYLMSGEKPSRSSNSFLKPQAGRYEVFYYNHLENKLEEYDVSLKDKNIISIQFDLNAQNELVIAGFYTNNFNFSVAGTFYFRLLPEAKDLAAAAYMALPKKLLELYLNEREMQKDKSINDLFLDHLVIEENGNTLLIGERYYITERMMNDISTGRQYIEYTYHHGDIIALQLNDAGKINWASSIAKNQSRLNNYAQHYGYHFGKKGDDWMFFFNDSKDNQERLSSKPDGSASSWNGSQNSVTTRVQLSSGGQINRFISRDNKQSDELLQPELTDFEPNQPLLLGFSTGKSVRFGLYD